MRKNNLLLWATLCAAVSLAPGIASAQPTNAPAAPMAPPPGGAPRLNPTARGLLSIRPAVTTLDRALNDLQRSENDFGGHRQAAIDACTKAKEELTEIAKQAGIPIPPQRMPGMMMPRPGMVPPPGANGAPPPQPAPPAQPAPPQ